MKNFFISKDSLLALRVLIKIYFVFAVVLSLIMAMAFGPELGGIGTVVERPSLIVTAEAYAKLWLPLVLMIAIGNYIHKSLDK